MAAERLHGADGLRGLACALVVLTHAAAFSLPGAGVYLQGLGKIGVWLFFALSAFLLTRRLLSGDGLASYALSRFVRIYPLFFLAVASHQLLGPSIGSSQEFIAVAALLAGPMHFWTIPVEVKFYVVLPVFVFLACWIQKSWGDRALLLAAAVALCLHQLVWPYWLAVGNSIELVWYLPTFGMSVVAALLMDRRAPPALATAVIAVVFVLIIGATPLARYLVLGIAPTDYLARSQVFFGAAFALLLWCVIARASASRSIFEWSLLRWAGKVSYPTYLFHGMAMTHLMGVLPRSWLSFLVLVVVSFAMGWLAHILVERPLQTWARAMLIPGRTPQSSAAAG